MKEEKRTIENTPPTAKKRKTRTSVRRKIFRQGSNQSSSPIVINELRQVSPTIHNLLVLIDILAHTVEDEENVEDDVPLLTFISKLRSRKTTPTLNTNEVQAKEDEEEEHEEPLDNFSELDVEILNYFEEMGIEDPDIFEEHGIEDPVVFEGQGIEYATISKDPNIEDPAVLKGKVIKYLAMVKG